MTCLWISRLLEAKTVSLCLMYWCVGCGTHLGPWSGSGGGGVGGWGVKHSLASNLQDRQLLLEIWVREEVLLN